MVIILGGEMESLAISTERKKNRVIFFLEVFSFLSSLLLWFLLISEKTSGVDVSLSLCQTQGEQSMGLESRGLCSYLCWPIADV